MSKIVFICHPIAGDVEGNLAAISEIVREINLNEPDVIPFVPYFADCVALNDLDPKERQRGIQNCNAIIATGIIKECRVYGKFITKGIFDEIQRFSLMDVPIIGMNDIIKENIADLLEMDIEGIEKNLIDFRPGGNTGSPFRCTYIPHL
jgi:hypothetical protein